MAFFNSTLTNGIQDISAILPLLGTEQVEMHIGSALTGGFLYAAACPISLFGSLGAVKIAFTIAITCTVIRRSPERSWRGAKWLADAGFSATGEVACLIGSPEAYLFGRDVLVKTADRSSVYLGEEKMSSVIFKSHIDNVDKLHIQLKSGLFLWNIGLISFSFICAAIGNTPYIYLLRHSNRSADSIPLWVYPVMRTLGTVVVVVCSQVMIQLRLLQILRTHMIFLSLRKLHETAEEDQADCASLTRTKIQQILDDVTDESKGKTADDWIWNLKHKLSTIAYPHSLINDTHINKLHADDMSVNDAHNDNMHIDNLRNEIAYQEHKHGVSPATTTLLIILGVIIFIGGIFTIIGYIGSYTVVQSASDSLGPLIWLTTEGVLSIVRIFIWGSNPGIDDHHGFELILDTSPNRPLVTCLNSEDEIESDKLLPLKRSDIFLREIASYIGPVESFAHELGVSIYYTLTGSAPFHTSSSKILYVTLYNYKEQASSVIVKISDLDTSKWGFFKVNGILWDTLRVQIGTRIRAQDNVFTQDLKFLEQLRDHCQDISVRLNRPQARPLYNQESSQSTAQEDPESQITKSHTSGPQYILGSNWSLVLEGSKAEEQATDLGKLTLSDTVYLKHGSSERAARNFYQRSGWWSEAHMALMRDELLQERPNADRILLGDKLELNEIDHLLISESLAIESALVRHIASRERSLYSQGRIMVASVLSDKQSFKLGHMDEKDILKKQLEIQGTVNAANRLKVAKEALISRLSQQRKSANERIDSSPENYRFAYDASMIDRWRLVAIDETTWDVAAQASPEDHMARHESAFQERLAVAQQYNNTGQATQTAELRQRNNANFSMAKARCIARQMAMRRRRQMEMDPDMQKRLQDAKIRVFSDAIVENGTADEARERIAAMVRIMRSKYTKYLDISDILIEQAGSLDMLLSLIKCNEVTAVITTSVKLTSEEEVKIAAVAAYMINVTYCDAYMDMEEMYRIPRLDVGGALPTITYNWVKVTDYYRRGNPYLLFFERGQSRCVIHFKATSGPLGNSGQKMLLLSHCGTRGASTPTKIQIILQRLNEADEEIIFRRTYSKNLNPDNFFKQYVDIDVVPGESYQVIIQLHEDSGAVYWLSSAELVDLEDAYQWCEDNSQLQED